MQSFKNITNSDIEELKAKGMDARVNSVKNS
jgi:hypothetical protein